MRSVLMISILALALAGCAHLDYVGESYAPTSDVAVYYAEANVPRAYRVMGEVVATADFLVSARKVQDKMVQKARDKGADAVVLLGMEHYKAGENTSYSENTTESKDKKGRTHVSTSGSSSTNIEEKKKIRALFIKYKPATESAAADTSR